MAAAVGTTVAVIVWLVGFVVAGRALWLRVDRNRRRTAWHWSVGLLMVVVATPLIGIGLGAGENRVFVAVWSWLFLGWVALSLMAGVVVVARERRERRERRSLDPAAEPPPREPIHPLPLLGAYMLGAPALLLVVVLLDTAAGGSVVRWLFEPGGSVLMSRVYPSEPELATRLLDVMGVWAVVAVVHMIVNMWRVDS